jgi:hypothetical protein
MALWLLAPVARCSFGAFRDIPISDVPSGEAAETADPNHADRDRIEQGAGFFHDWFAAMKYCYRRTPLLEQEDWKSGLLVGFGGLMVIAWGLARLSRRPRPTT